MEVLLRMGVFGSGMIVAMLLARPLLFRLMPRAVPVVLWLIVFARLLLPLSVSAWLFAQTAISDVGTSVSSPEPVRRVVATLGDASDVLAAPLVDAPQVVVSAIVAIWMAGAATCLAVHVVALARLASSARTAPVSAEARRVVRVPLAGMRRHVSLRESLLVSSPLTYGLFRPVILVPVGFAGSGRDKAALMLRHELSHVRHLDVLWKALAVLACCLHWFNPLVWIAFSMFSRDLELARDESVIRTLDDEDARAYGNALLDMAEGRLRAPSVSTTFDGGSLRERISAIVDRRRPRVAVSAMATILACVPLLAFALPGVSAGGDVTSSTLDAPSAEEVLAGGYPTNSAGLTYGGSVDGVDWPDLMLAVNGDGVRGYVRRSDVFGPMPSTPEEALEYMEREPGTRQIPMYADEELGEVVGYLTIGGDSDVEDDQ